MAVGKVSLSIDEDLLAEGRARAGRREPSSSVNEARRRQLQRDRLTVARLILDTTLLLATERDRKRLDGMVDDDDVVIAAITAAELLVGVHVADDAHRQGRAAFVEEVLDIIPTEDHDLDVARAHAELLAHTRSVGRPRGAHDLIIAATARCTGRIVVSADATAFTDLPSVVHRP